MVTVARVKGLTCIVTVVFANTGDDDDRAFTNVPEVAALSSVDLTALNLLDALELDD